MARKIAKALKGIAGIRIPQRVRKGTLASLISTPAGQLILAEVLLVVGGALATAANPDTRTGRALRQAIGEGIGELRNGRSRKSGQNLSVHLREGLVKGVGAFRQAMQRDPAEPEIKDVGPRVAKKKPSRPLAGQH